MITFVRGIFLLTPWLIGCVTAGHAHAIVTDCDGSTRLEQSFDSGASWSLCARVDEKHGLEVSSVHFRAPGDSLRSVLNIAHVGQILVDYHDQTEPLAQIGAAESGRLLIITEKNCDGSLLLDEGTGATLCSRIENNGILAKYSQRPSLQSKRWELSSAIQREGLTWAVSITFSEDGQITPAISLSGRARESLAGPAFATSLPASGKQVARVSVLTTWRLVFNLDDSAFDDVQQFDFVLDISRGNRRPMQVRDLNTEQFTTVERKNFRGWRVIDPIGTGYFLDPSNSGFNYAGRRYNWARFDLGVTRFADCERYASGNQTTIDNIDTCGSSLDDFVSGESLENAHPVLWFSQTRTLNPTNEDWPVISNFHQSFTLLPYDWTPSSPFELSE